MKTLVIVESPAKAGTISKILGKDYDVTSSFGHVRDLAKDGEKNTGVDIAHKYKPHYIVPDEKKKVVNELKKRIKKYDKVILATDEDREGEAIAWHLKEVLKLKANELERITFTEITPEAIKSAVASPRKIDSNLVDAQQTRRILDRLVGFELTSLLWKKVRGKLSAGRVQSVAVRLLVDREREIKKFKPDSYFKVTGTFSSKKNFEAELSERIKSASTAKELLNSCSKATFTIDSVEKKPSKRKPSPPFTTSTLQQLASQKLGFSVSRTMSTAQKLYEAGHITYMRTDSISMSKSALASIASYVKKEYGENYSTVRNYKTKSKSSQEAHEAIRPTYINKVKVTDNPDQHKLYSLIRSRALASQMADAEVEKTTVKIDISTSKKYHFVSKGEIVTFDGFLKAYSGTKYYAQDDILLPDLKKGQQVEAKHIQALERKTKPPARYSEATLVKKLEELGIGRPSTYAPTIAKITSPSRGYIVKESRDGEPTDYTLYVLKKGAVHEDVFTESTGSQKNKLFAREISLLVTDFLCDNFESIMEYSFTAEVEDKLDDIATGDVNWVAVLDQYYKPFTKTAKTVLEKAERVTGERILGKDPESGKTLLVRMSRYGPVAQIGQPDELKEGESPHYANLLPTQELDTVTKEDALKLFELPKAIGQYKSKDIIIGRGRYGPYVKYDEHYVSLGRNTNPFTVKLEEAKEKVIEKLKEMEPVAYYEDEPITRGKGRFGPYIKWKDTFVSVTKKSGIDFDNIKEKDAIKLLKEKIQKDKDRLIHSWDDGKITLQKGRWGPVFRIKGRRGFIAIPKDSSGNKMDTKELQKLSDKDIKSLLKK